MKKLFIVLFAIVLVASFVNAQGVTGYGPKAQINMANVSGDNSSDNKMAILFGFGGFLTYNVIPELDLQGEVLYSQKGCELEYPGQTVSITGSYLEINALAKYPIPMEGDIKPAIFAGPSIGILMSATVDPVAPGQSDDVKDNFESLDYGIIFGAGVTINVGDGSLVADVRYNLGLANILKVGGSVYSQQNQVISICVGYAFL